MESATIHRKESLILTAIEVIDELGVQGLSVREVAKRQGISNASIFSHFKSKSELMQSVLDHYSQYDYAVVQAIKIKMLKSADAIKYFVESYYTYYESYPQITAIALAYDVLRCEEGLSDKIKSILYNRCLALGLIVKEAQAAGEIRSDVDSETISNIILGSCRELCLKWRVESFAFPLKDRVMYTLDAILDSFKQK
jgi:Transcriptional regulator